MTRSVAIAGVLLVFCYLIVPVGGRDAVRGQDRDRAWPSAGRWGPSCRHSACTLSLMLDLPTGATIVCTFGLVLILMAIVRVLVPRRGLPPVAVIGHVPSRCGIVRGREPIIRRMQCRNCGTEIADKAIVCYRCGVGTTDPVRKPVTAPARPAAVCRSSLRHRAVGAGADFVASPQASGHPTEMTWPRRSCRRPVGVLILIARLLRRR